MLLTARNELGLSREYVAGQIPCGVRSLQDYESYKTIPPPEVMLGAGRALKKPGLPLWHCKNQCPIGQLYYHQITEKSLRESVIQLINAINQLLPIFPDLLSIAEDDKITPDEVPKLLEHRPIIWKAEHGVVEYRLRLCTDIPIEQVMGIKKDTGPKVSINYR